MFQPKYRRSWLLVSIVVLPLSYVLAGTTLMRNDIQDIAFTTREAEGLQHYEKLYPLYIHAMLHKDAKPREAQRLREQMRTLGDDYNIVLDPEPLSYYLGDLLFNRLPWIWDLIHTQSDSRLRMVETLSHIDSIFTKHHASPELRAALNKVQYDLWADVPTDAAAADIVDLTKISLRELRNELQARLKKAKFHRNLGWIILFGFYAMSVALIRAAVKNYVFKREVDAVQERHRLISELESKNKELESFTFATAHDLKEPIRTLRSFAQLLQRPHATADETAQRLAILDQTSARAERILNDLLGYTQINEHHLECEPCCMAEEIDHVMQDLSANLAGVDYELHQTPLAQVNMVTVTSLFRRIWLNLIDNAIKYRKPNQRLMMKLSAQKEEGGWHFALEDNGIGIEKKFFTRAFEPFTRFSPGNIPGSGIGLASCKKIVELLGGRIWFEPTGGKGTRVCVWLPDMPAGIPNTRMT